MVLCWFSFVSMVQVCVFGSEIAGCDPDSLWKVLYTPKPEFGRFFLMIINVTYD